MSLTQTNGQIREEGPLTETERMRDFKFERVYGPDAAQTGVYEQSASNIVNAVLRDIMVLTGVFFHSFLSF